MELSGLDIFDQGDKVTTRRYSSVDSKVESLASQGKWDEIENLFGVRVPDNKKSECMKDIQSFVNEQLHASKKHDINKTIYWPKPYGKLDDNRYGAKFTICGDVKPYMNQVHAIRNYLLLRMDVNFCIKAHIEGMRDERDIAKLPSEEERNSLLKKLKEDRDCFLHYSILAYTGFFKAVKRQKEDMAKPAEEKWQELYFECWDLEKQAASYKEGRAERQIALDRLGRLTAELEVVSAEAIRNREDIEQYAPIIETARELAIDSLIEAAKVYNPNVSPESIENRCRNEKHTVTKIRDSVDEISDLFAQYFYDPTDANTKLESIQRRQLFYEAMQLSSIESKEGATYGMKDVLKELERRTEIKDSVSHIPNFFSNMFERFTYLKANGSSPNGKA